MPVNNNKFEITSPKTAPRQWPTCNGPVGFADTNSILYFLFLLYEPYFFLFFKIKLIFFIQDLFDSLMFIKPGPAISTSEKSVIFFNKIFLIFSAISLGFVLFFFLKLMQY